jgi:hypothetical protein
MTPIRLDSSTGYGKAAERFKLRPRTANGRPRRFRVSRRFLPGFLRL